MLTGLGIDVPDLPGSDQESARPAKLEYWREYVLPWIGRRLTGRSSGNAREPKHAGLTGVEIHSRFPEDH